jgi:hypothetical protein
MQVSTRTTKIEFGIRIWEWNADFRRFPRILKNGGHEETEDTDKVKKIRDHPCNPRSVILFSVQKKAGPFAREKIRPKKWRREES